MDWSVGMYYWKMRLLHLKKQNIPDGWIGCLQWKFLLLASQVIFSSVYTGKLVGRLWMGFFIWAWFSSHSKYPHGVIEVMTWGNNMCYLPPHCCCVGSWNQALPKRWLEGFPPTVSSCPKPNSERGTWVFGRTISKLPPSFMRLGGFAQVNGTLTQQLHVHVLYKLYICLKPSLIVAHTLPDYLGYIATNIFAR